LQDLSLHVLDIVENSITAGANKVKITVSENNKDDKLILEIQDNGTGINKEKLANVTDPFYTTKESKNIGLGLAMLAQAAKQSNGNLEISSRKGQGTIITATFMYSHIDRKPIGNMTETLITLIMSKGMDIDLIYEHHKNDRNFIFDTEEIKKELRDVPINDPEVIEFLKENLTQHFKELQKEQK
jgi:anti-sigma regulatory factor (Ser/Thr protein kinase)